MQLQAKIYELVAPKPAPSPEATPDSEVVVTVDDDSPIDLTIVAAAGDNLESVLDD
jgi:hypothetical protein